MSSFFSATSHGLRDRDAQRAGRIRVHRQHVAAGVGQVARRLVHSAAVGLHQDAAVRLLVVADADHEDLDVDAVERTGDRHGATPLAGAGLGRDLGDAFGLVVVGLRDGGVGLVAARRRNALVLVVDAHALGQVQVLLQLTSAQQRRRTVLLVDVDDGAGDVDPAVRRRLLLEHLHREELHHHFADLVRRKFDAVGRDHLGRRRRVLQVRDDVVPGLRDVQFVESESGLIGWHGGAPLVVLLDTLSRPVDHLFAHGRLGDARQLLKHVLGKVRPHQRLADKDGVGSRRRRPPARRRASSRRSRPRAAPRSSRPR